MIYHFISFLGQLTDFSPHELYLHASLYAFFLGSCPHIVDLTFLCLNIFVILQIVLTSLLHVVVWKRFDLFGPCF